MTDNLIMTDKEWFNPVNVISEFKRLEAIGAINPKVEHYKKLKEAYVSAVSLIGMIPRLKLNFWLQIVDDKEGSPDIRTICQKPGGVVNEFTWQDVEIVTFEKHSSDSIVDFLLQTKLSQKKGYDDLTNILCFVDKYVTVPPAKEINERLTKKKINIQSPIMLLGKLYENKNEYQFFQVYPEASMSFTFDLDNIANDIATYPGRLKFTGKGKLGTPLKYVDDGTPVHPFEKLGYK